MSANGYVQLRRGVLQHCREGKLPPTIFAMYIHLILEADKASGVVWSSAKSLASRYGYGERHSRSALESLETKGYIRRFPIPGRHGEYPILVNKYCPSTGARKGSMLNAKKSADWQHLVFENCEETCRERGEHRGEETAPLQEGKGKVEITTSSPSATPGQNGNFQLSPAPTNGNKDEAFLKIIERQIPFFLEKSGKRSYALHSKPGRQNGPARMQMLIGGLKELHQAIALQCPEYDANKLMSKTESACHLIIEEFCRSDWHMGRDSKTNGIKYDDPATYAFKNLATMERWLGW